MPKMPKPKQSKVNRDRAKRALAMLRTVDVYDEHDIQSAVVDALSDLRHLCDAEGLAWERMDRIAYQNYLAERSTQ